jgi:integrase
LRTNRSLAPPPDRALTDAEIRNLEPRAVRFDVADGDVPGLELRVWPNGTKRWCLRYRRKDGAARRLSLGRYGSKQPALTLAAARKKARQTLTDVQRGTDPQADRIAGREARLARRDASKLSDLLDDFTKDQSPAWRPSTRAGWLRFIEADIKPALGKRIPAELTPDDVARFVDTLKRTRGPVSVARAFEVLRRALRWAHATRRLQADPSAGLNAHELVARAKVSDRVFNDVELLAILAGAAVTELRLLVPFLLYTGARGGEARSAEWKDVDTKARVWTVPTTKSKTGVAHRVPLSEGAIAVLDELEDAGRWLFPAPTAAGYMDRSQKVVEQVRAISGVDDFSLHHLRRTLRQRLTDAGVALHVAEAVLGHLPPVIVRTYSPQWEPLREMRLALEAWSRELSSIARGQEHRGADVVPIEARR